MEYPRCHLYFLLIHTVFKLIVHIFEGNTCTGVLCVISCYNNNNYYCTSYSVRSVTGQFCRPYSTVRPAKLESSLSCAPD